MHETIGHQRVNECPEHGERLERLPNAQWKRCTHVGEKGGRCKFTRR